MLSQEDLELSYSDKLKLIARIEYWQQQRRQRFKFFFANRTTLPAFSRVMVKHEIQLIREQQGRLEELKILLNN